jgi:poly-gamma-glutamate synthesis protein (capsule biosynthesis protein)
MTVFRLLVMLIFLFGSNIFYVSAQKKAVKNYSLTDLADKDGELSFHFVGDLMGHSPLFKFAQTSMGYDFFPYFEPVSEILADADITVGNLETVLAGKTKDYSGYPAFNTPNEYADALKKTGFDFLVTTNNHSFDRGEKGVLRTLDELQKRNFYTFGTYRNLAERDSVRIFKAENISFALLAYTQFSNIRVPAEKHYLVNVHHENLLKRQIAEARAAGAELVIVHFHWGEEYKKEPNFVQKEMTRIATESGADAVVANHPHVLQPFEIKKASPLAAVDSVFIAYSLGNFISNQQWRYSDAGAILRLVFSKKAGKIKLSTSAYVPVWVFKGIENEKNSFRILPSALAEKNIEEKKHFLNILNKENLRRMKEAHADTKTILALYGVKSAELSPVPYKRIRLFPIDFEKPVLVPVFQLSVRETLSRIELPKVKKKKRFWIF